MLSSVSSALEIFLATPSMKFGSRPEDNISKLTTNLRPLRTFFENTSASHMHERNCRGMCLPAKMAKCWALNLQLTACSRLAPWSQAHWDHLSWTPEPPEVHITEYLIAYQNTNVSESYHPNSSSHIKASRSVGFSISSPVVSFEFAYAITSCIANSDWSKELTSLEVGVLGYKFNPGSIGLSIQILVFELPTHRNPPLIFSMDFALEAKASSFSPLFAVTYHLPWHQDWSRGKTSARILYMIWCIYILF